MRNCNKYTYTSLDSITVTVFTSILFIFTFILFCIIIFQSYRSAGCLDSCCSSCPKCETIDVVYTWVNGSDPLLLREMMHYSEAQAAQNHREDDLMPSRYDDKQELKYSLRSLEKYAKWIRNVYIVTANQIPWWLDVRNSHVQLITHEDIIPSEYLPTFSSPAIECFIHKIPGLSKRFLYFNDDIFLGGPFYLSDLYTETDGYHVYTSWNVPDCSPGCPWSFLGDNSCDSACNNVECDYDGGDCIGDLKTHKRPGISHLDYLGEYDDNPFFDDSEKDDYLEPLAKYPGLEEHPAPPDELHKQQDEDRALLGALLNNKQDLQTAFDIDKHSRSLKTLSGVYEAPRLGRTLKSSPIGGRKSLLARLEKLKNLNISREVANFNKKVLNSGKKLRKSREAENETKVDNRKLDMYAKSLIHTNKIFNKMYGFQNRKVPAHVPILLDKDIIENMQEKFVNEIEITKRNKFRRANDFQFAFAYFHYLMTEKREVTIEEIFDLYDTDKSGTWSDREVRTVLTKIRGLPITAAAVSSFEVAAKACDKDEYKNHPTPSNERYLDSEMPTLTRDLVCGCGPLRGSLRASQPPMSDHKGHARSAIPHATFAMLSSNITKAVTALDEIRRETKKFICINDNLDPAREEENLLVRMLLQELYEALLPIPSQFELPHGVANRFLRISEFKEWQRSRRAAWSALICCIILLVFITVWQSRCCRYRNLRTYCSLRGYL